MWLHATKALSAASTPICRLAWVANAALPRACAGELTNPILGPAHESCLLTHARHPVHPNSPYQNHTRSIQVQGNRFVNGARIVLGAPNFFPTEVKWFVDAWGRLHPHAAPTMW